MACRAAVMVRRRVRLRAGSMMTLRSKVAVLGLCAGIFFPAAATVSSQGGTVLISKGEGFAPITGDAQVGPGGQVMVRPGSVATIAYGSSCIVRVGSGVWLVQEAAPCSPGTTFIDFTGRMNQQPPADPPPGDDQTPPGIDPTTGLIIGGVAVAGGVALAI